MSLSTICPLLQEATVTIYAAQPGGAPGSQLWVGSAEETFSQTQDLGAVTAWPAAADRPVVFNDDGGLWTIEFSRLWVVPNVSLADFNPDGSAEYVIDLLWSVNQDEGYYRRQYRHCTAQRLAIADAGQHPRMQFVTRQQFLATQLIESSDGSAPAGQSQIAAFFHEDPLFTGEYFVGFYVWSQPMRLTRVDGVWAPNPANDEAETTLALEVDGVTEWQGDLFQSAATSEAVDILVPAGSAVRVKCYSAPTDPALVGSLASVVVSAVPA